MRNKASTPVEARGDTPLVVVNHTNSKVCWLFLELAGTSSDQNWLRDLMTGAEGLEVGETREFKVKPGRYLARVEGCMHEYVLKNQPITIAGATYLNIGDAKPTPPSGYSVVRLRGREKEGCEDPGFDIDSPSHCCSRHAHREYQPYNRLVCD